MPIAARQAVRPVSGAGARLSRCRTTTPPARRADVQGHVQLGAGRRRCAFAAAIRLPTARRTSTSCSSSASSEPGDDCAGRIRAAPTRVTSTATSRAIRTARRCRRCARRSSATGTSTVRRRIRTASPVTAAPDGGEIELRSGNPDVEQRGRAHLDARCRASARRSRHALRRGMTFSDRLLPTRRSPMPSRS